MGGPGTSKDSTSGPGPTSEERVGESAFTLHKGTCTAFMLVTMQQRKPTVACIRYSGTSRARRAGQRTVQDIYASASASTTSISYQGIYIWVWECIQYSKLWICVFFHSYHDMNLWGGSSPFTPCAPVCIMMLILFCVCLDLYHEWFLIRWPGNTPFDWAWQLCEK